jgi:hypothetical protein
MTICVAAIAQSGIIFGAADRMKTGGDVEFEPRKHELSDNARLSWVSGSKIFRPTTSLAAMTAGDASLQIEIHTEVFSALQARITNEPSNWWKVKEFAELYVRFYDIAKAKRAASAVLVPLGLDSDSFVAKQTTMHPDFVKRITDDLTYFKMPRVQTLFLGVDAEGSHIYIVDNLNQMYSCDVRSQDTIGFAAIGSGARHATSQFMLVGHHRAVPSSETLFLTYLAKKRAEVAPGVGKETDMIAVGPGLGQSAVVHRDVINGIDSIYKSYRASEARIMKAAFRKAEQFEKNLLGKQGPQGSPPQPPPDGNSTPPVT